MSEPAECNHSNIKCNEWICQDCGKALSSDELHTNENDEQTWAEKNNVPVMAPVADVPCYSCDQRVTIVLMPNDNQWHCTICGGVDVPYNYCEQA